MTQSVGDERLVRSVETLCEMVAGEVDAYEIFVSCDDGFSVEAEGGSVDTLKARSSSGVGLRTIQKGRQGFGFTNVLDTDALKSMVGDTLSGSKSTTVDEYLAFSTPEAAGEGLDLKTFDTTEATTEAERIECAIRIEKSALDVDPRVQRVRKASYSESTSSSRVVNSNGVDVAQSATYSSASVMAVAEEGGEAQMGWDVGLSHSGHGIDPEAIGAGAAKNALRMLGARKIETVKCPAVIENVVVSELLGSLAGSFLADNVHKNKSMLNGKLGKKVASSVLSIHDNALMVGGWASSLYDGEGVPCRDTPLMVDGVVEAFLYDGYWARRDCAATTGSSSRSGYKGLPSIGFSNLYIEGGEKSLDGLLAEIPKGLLITELLGVHTINTVNGDFSIGAAGLWVEGGELKYPVRGMAISGNLLELFGHAAECGSDLRFIGSIGAPSILFNEIEASGT
ncbi:MAG: TldD/PmbA family protein [Proteobacteria bacterium]|nr:TldD/PmbA family protein [Pseudomonadota bacterium]